jgi:hypothetical protein
MLQGLRGRLSLALWVVVLLLPASLQAGECSQHSPAFLCLISKVCQLSAATLTCDGLGGVG